ncbi:hypothetical protein BMS3Abin07_01091 [bacterium BMS3Abin07]|nr:hypothetical protein BMS3Abin07_01091 [bacterium BMS3Abin07]GBE31916.1 hypothetical protein BMS3Bbin05_00820 [bacterium BMS3Bbin05]HDL20483.1 hypothetical protein [Nitrospirota bacterium]HDO23206.1 hypothetical protein [Nitrospirota bacterium]HDZ87112.1 hypothetical protein [Nitrospirota bacterium]
MKKKKLPEEMTTEELKKELKHTNECLLDEEEVHAFTLNRASIHIGGVEAQAMQEEHERKCNEYRERIEQIEQLLNERAR